MDTPNEANLPFSDRVTNSAREERIAEWIETLNSFIYLIKDLECWYHFCLFGFFYIPKTGKYAEVSIYQNDNPEFAFRCISYSRVDPSNFDIFYSELDMVELIERVLIMQDPNSFFLTYNPVRWDMVDKAEIIDSPDMEIVDRLYRESEKI